MRAAGKFTVRTGLGLGALSLFSGAGESIGVYLGVNLVNAAVLGALGLPGCGLLLLLNWLVR